MQVANTGVMQSVQNKIKVEQNIEKAKKLAADNMLQKRLEREEK